MKKSLVVLAIIAIVFFLFQWATEHFQNEKKEQSSNDYVGDLQCRSCHSSEHEQWLASDHFKAMQPANDSTVLGDFNNVTYNADGITSRFFRKGEEFYINTESADGSSQDFKILYTFGHYPLQQYLIAFPGGRMQVTRQSWDSKDKKWFHQYSGQKIVAHDWLHWTGNAQNWNTMCARCHSTDLQKNYVFDSDSFNTVYNAVSVNCESCHGPGKQHIEFVSSKKYKAGQPSFILSGKNTGQLAQINTCAPCHMRGEEIGTPDVHADNLLDNYMPEIPSTDNFHADGQVREESFTYTSFLQSKMFRRGVKCTDCHNAHTGKVFFQDNRLCTNCHDSKTYDNYSHTFHATGTAASDCISCHAPGSYFMGNDYRHDHSFRVPRPDLSVKYGTPNACNNCHTTQSAQWATEAVNKWYGSKRIYHFAEDLIPASRREAGAETHVLRLMNDTAVPSIVKVAAVHYLRDIHSSGSLQLLLQGLKDEDAQVRYRSLMSLQDFSPSDWLQEAMPMLEDKVKAVRIAAAELMLNIPKEQFADYAAYLKAKKELEDYILYQVDFASGSLKAGDYYMRLNDYSKAEGYYKRAIQKDAALNNARLNLAVIYNSKGKNEEALNILKEAQRINPKDDNVYYSLALLYYELDSLPLAEQNFAKAVALKSPNPKVYYNYALLMQQAGRKKQAEELFRKAESLSLP